MTRYVEDDISILSTSYFPNKTEARELRARIANRYVQLSLIDENIQIPRRAIMRTILVAEGLLAPVRKLPTEILGEIFAYYIPSFCVEMALDPRIAGWPPAFFNASESHPAQARSILRQVCRRWAKATLDTPHLWSTITIDHKLSLTDFEQALIYSRACPLDIYICRLPTSHEEEFDLILDLLRTSLHRTRQLVFADYDAPCRFWGIFPVEQCTKAPILEVIAWYWQADAGGSAPVVPSPTIGQIDAPNLKSIACVGSPLTYKFITEDSLRKLQRFCFEAQRAPFNWRDHVNFLRQCPSLVELEICHISQWDIEDQPQFDGTKVTLLNLTKLKVLDSETPSTIIFLKLLHAPNLKILSLRLDAPGIRTREGHPAIDEGLRILIAEAPTSLQTMKLSRLVIHGDDGPLLPLFSNLFELEFTRCVIRDRALTDLIPVSFAASEAWPCPRLSQLTFNRSKLPGDMLIRLVRSRTSLQSPPTRCTSIIIGGCPTLKESHKTELTQLAQTHSRTLRYIP